jgi:hypothetical protein
MAKLNAKQIQKVNIIKNYLEHDSANNKNGLLIDCDQTSIYCVTNIFINASGIWLAGSKAGGHTFIRENIFPSEINGIYRACLKDDDFKFWFEQQ